MCIDGELPENADEDDIKIKNLLKYIGESKEKNIPDDTIGELDRIVKATILKKEVGIRYMKSWEWERDLREEGREEERANTERERKRADETLAELAKYKAKYG